MATITPSFSLRGKLTLNSSALGKPIQLQNGLSHIPLDAGEKFSINGKALEWIEDDDWIGWLWNGWPFKTDQDVLFGGGILVGNYLATPKRDCRHLQSVDMVPDVRIEIEKVESKDGVSMAHDTELKIKPRSKKTKDYVPTLRQFLIDSKVIHESEGRPAPTIHRTHFGGRVTKKAIESHD